MTPAQAELTQAAANGARRTYRGRDLAEVLPRIRAELGPDAVVTCQREGLVGGIRGFFAQRFVEVEAMPAHTVAAVDVYDGEDADPETAEYEALTGPVPESPADAPVVVGESFTETLDGVVAVASQDGFAAQLAAAATLPAGDATEPVRSERRQQPDPFAFDTEPIRFGQSVPPATAAARTPAPPAPAAIEREAGWAAEPPTAMPRFVDVRPEPVTEPARSPQAASAQVAVDDAEVHRLLLARGISRRLAEDLVSESRAHDLPFAGGSGMRDALRTCVARRLPRHRGITSDGALIAIVGGGGSGKTRCAAAITASYRSAGALEVRAVVLGRYDSGATLAALVGPLGVAVQTAERGSRAAAEIAEPRRGALVVADTPTVSPGDPAGIGMLAVELAALAPEEVLVTLPATSNAIAAKQLLAALAPLSPSGIIVTHADETDQLGTAVELSIESGLPLVYVHSGLDLPGALTGADPATIAEHLLR